MNTSRWCVDRSHWAVPTCWEGYCHHHGSLLRRDMTLQRRSALIVACTTTSGTLREAVTELLPSWQGASLSDLIATAVLSMEPRIASEQGQQLRLLADAEPALVDSTPETRRLHRQDALRLELLALSTEALLTALELATASALVDTWESGVHELVAVVRAVLLQ